MPGILLLCEKLIVKTSKSFVECVEGGKEIWEKGYQKNSMFSALITVTSNSVVFAQDIKKDETVYVILDEMEIRQSKLLVIGLKEVKI